jgi:hypothetical protein
MGEGILLKKLDTRHIPDNPADLSRPWVLAAMKGLKRMEPKGAMHGLSLVPGIIRWRINGAPIGESSSQLFGTFEQWEIILG